MIASRISASAPVAGEMERNPETRVAIVGKPNVGKSSLVNRLLREERVIVSSEPGTTRDSIDLEITIDKNKYILVDNAGIRKMQKVKEDTESAAVVRAEKNIRLADVVIFVVDLSRKIDHNDLFIARKVIRSAKPVVVAANKWDLVSEKSVAQSVIKKLRSRFNQFYFAPIVLVSAETGKNMHTLIRKIVGINEILHGGVKTPRLNQVIRAILSEKRLLLENNRVFNPKYASVESTRPFFIRFFAGRTTRLKAAAETYIKKRLVEELGLEGVPVFFNIKPK
jgi:GTP-binding protein